jgi:hypothetical protein
MAAPAVVWAHVSLVATLSMCLKGCPATSVELSFMLAYACRCLHTATLALEGVQSNATNVEEFVRETLGMDTCDARRSVSDPNSNAAPSPQVRTRFASVFAFRFFSCVCRLQAV